MPGTSLMCALSRPSFQRSSRVFSGPAFSGFALASAAAFLLTGCGMGPAAPSLPVQGNGTLMKGNVHGGQQPVVGANIQLWAAGTGDYPGGASYVAPVSLLTTPVTTGSDGGFNISNDYVCPSVPAGQQDTQVYLTATGGDPGAGSANSNLAMMAALGSCTALQANAATTFIYMNEVTTVAAAYALAPFAMSNGPATSGISVSTSSTNTLGLANAMKTANNMINLATGQALTRTPFYATGTVAYLNSSTVPQSRINTLANILASCVNTNGVGGSSNGCAMLFAAATPSGGTAPSDTLQAILDIAQNPGNNVSTLYGLTAPTAPFQPQISSGTGLTDWTLALGFTGGGLGLLPPGAGGYITPTSINIDSVGNVLVTAFPTSSPSNGFLTEFNNLGEALTPATSLSGSTPTFGGYALPVSYIWGTLHGAAIDPSDHLWLTGGSPGAFEVASQPSISLLQTISTASYAWGLGFDSFGNVWVGETGANYQKFTSTGTAPVSYANPTGDYFQSIIVDSNGYLWGAGASHLYAYSFNGSQETQYGLYPAVYDSNIGPIPPVADNAGNLYACGPNEDAINVYNASVSTTVPAHSYSQPNGCYYQPSIDGLGHLFTEGYTTGLVLQETGSDGTNLSQAGYTGTSAGEAGTISNNAGIFASAVDDSGNLWVVNMDNGYMPSNDTLVEFVGLAAPIITPTSLALSDGALATRP